MTDILAANLVHFVRYLRDRGLAVVPATARDLAAGIEVVGLDRRDDLYAALSSITVVRPAERVVFDEAFELFFGTGQVRRGRRQGMEVTARTTRPPEQGLAGIPVLAPRGQPAADEEPEEVVEIAGGTYAERLAHRDFRDLSVDEADEVRRLIARMVWRPADAASRRWGPAKQGTRPDLRRTFRETVGPGGDLMPLAMARRRRRKRPLVVLADVSGSMERYTEMFLYFIHAAQGRLGRVESFVFATRLSRITRQMRIRTPVEALSRVSHAVTDWAGGTRIGEALEEFNRSWSRRVTRGGAIGLVISDGWDTGDAEVLDREACRFARSVHRVVWLNPLAGRAGFAPETRGLRTVLPYVDDFLAAGRLTDLRAVVRLLESIGSRPGSGHVASVLAAAAPKDAAVRS